MSQSRRKRPFCGITTAETEKKDKRFFQRRWRRRVRTRLGAEQYDALPLLREVSDIWTADKDGKQRFDPLEWPKGMRK